jgi:hypothetical protein
MIWIELIVCAALIFWVGSLLPKCIAIAGMYVSSIVLLYVLV